MNSPLATPPTGSPEPDELLELDEDELLELDEDELLELDEDELLELDELPGSAVPAPQADSKSAATHKVAIAVARSGAMLISDKKW